MIKELLKKIREIEDEQEKLEFLEAHLDEIKDEKLRARVKELVEKIKKKKLEEEIKPLTEKETIEQPEENLAETLSETFTTQATLPEQRTEALEETHLRARGFSELEDIASSLPTEEKPEEETKSYTESSSLYKEERKYYDRERILSEIIVSLKERGLIRALPQEERFEFRTKDIKLFLRDIGFTTDQIQKYTNEIRNFLKYKEYKFEKGDKEKLDTILKKYE